MHDSLETLDRNVIASEDHWAKKGDVRLSLWRKRTEVSDRGTILFVHGSSMAGRPTFDLQVKGRPDMSAMDWFARRGFDVWSVDMEGYGLSDKKRPINCDISNGADDLVAAATYIKNYALVNRFLVYGISSGALRAALFCRAQAGVYRATRSRRVCLDGGEQSNTCRAAGKFGSLPRCKSPPHR